MKSLFVYKRATFFQIDMIKLVITCEHATNAIPYFLLDLFAPYQMDLVAHQGYDIGALSIAKAIAINFADFYIFAEYSRLVVDLNRSLHHPKLFSPLIKALNKQIKDEILQSYYFPYRKKVEEEIENMISEGHKVIHLSMHSFTPVLNDRVRDADFGLLYDPRRKYENKFCRLWKKDIKKIASNLKVRMNYPYQGKSDALVTYLRKQFKADCYIGIELEVNQKFFLRPETFEGDISACILNSFKATLHDFAF